ncbi:MAG: hypothetical protein Q8T11_03400 [Elusimicrobiota bacterium]|nr:hypothetical protein [Elusimicrobiota bacterium]
MRRSLALAILFASASSAAHAASLDVTASYKMKAASYSNLHYDTNDRNNHSFITNDARLGIAVRRIPLETRGGEDTTMDLGIVLRSLGVSGSTSSVASPFDRVASYYPNADLTPFIENAYLKVHRLWGYPWEATFGRQSYRLGGGLLLDDDGAGLTGASARGELPWWNMKVEGFIFNDRNPLHASAPNSLDLAGVSVDLPGEGVWQLNQLIERDRAQQTVYGCSYTGNPQANGCLVSKAVRSFTGLRYQISYGPMVFDGEAAMQKGYATPTGPNPAGNHITYNGNAQVVRMKWKQSLWKTGQGIARMSVARGTGDDPGTATTDEAFFPSRGHRHNGLERTGFGELFAATAYDAFGGNFSTTTKSGLRNGASGLVVVGAGYTPPAYKGVTLDIDFFLYQAERISSGSRTLGTEWDLRLRYPIRDQLQLAATMAYFRAGKFTDPGRSVARKYAFEASGRF